MKIYSVKLGYACSISILMLPRTITEKPRQKKTVPFELIINITNFDAFFCKIDAMGAFYAVS